MNPLDLLKVKYQVTTTNPSGNLGKRIWLSLKDIQQSQGWKGLYRGIIPNIAGNASSWGLYFLLCVIFSMPRILVSDLYSKLQHAEKSRFWWGYYKTTLGT
jgi:Mitochondrial carrier protein